MSKKLPPYARNMNSYAHTDDCIIYTGVNAWQVARSKTRLPRTPKLVLPPKDDPAAYQWPVSGRYCQIWTCGEPEPHETLFKLARLLLEAGAVKVVLFDLSRPLVVIEPKRRAAA